MLILPSSVMRVPVVNVLEPMNSKKSFELLCPVHESTPILFSGTSKEASKKEFKFSLPSLLFFAVELNVLLPSTVKGHSAEVLNEKSPLVTIG